MLISPGLAMTQQLAPHIGFRKALSFRRNSALVTNTKLHAPELVPLNTKIRVGACQTEKTTANGFCLLPAVKLRSVDVSEKSSAPVGSQSILLFHSQTLVDSLLFKFEAVTCDVSE